MSLFRRLDRSGLDGNTVFRTSVKQKFKINVPAEHADAVRVGLERWAASKGWAAIVRTEPKGDKVELSFEHDQSAGGSPPQVEAEGMADELQKVLEDAMRPGG